VTRGLWCELKQAMDTVLESRTVQDLVEQSKAIAEKNDGMYYI
jgi:DNA-binding IscR family transcriptional regulator